MLKPIIDAQYEDFHINQYVSFKKIFKQNDFELFNQLSGDANPLHFNAEYASHTAFNTPIVPMHLATLPLSAIAGMIFPGHRSLYLNTNIQALEPIYYDDEITYSAKLISKSDMTSILKVRTILFKNKLILLKADQTIKVRNDVIPNQFFSVTKDQTMTPTSIVNYAFITGASGEIGKNIALSLAQCGFHLILHYHKNEKSVEECKKRCLEYGVNVLIAQADLTDHSSVEKLGCLVKDKGVTHFVHAASSKLDSHFNALMNSNYVTLKIITECLLPNMLKMQFGKIILIGSSAIQSNPKDWDDYVAAKTAALSYMNAINKHFKDVGLHAFVFSPGLVATEFSKNIRKHNDRSLLPEQVAKRVVDIIASHDETHDYYCYEPHGERYGSFGFQSATLSKPVISGNEKVDIIEISSPSDSIETKLNQFIRKFFKLNHDYPLEGSRFEEYQHWTSLKHLEFLLEVEKLFNVTLSSSVIDKTHVYDDLLQVLRYVSSQKYLKEAVL